MAALFIDPGRLRSECALEACLPLADAMGGHTENWVEVATVFALVEPSRPPANSAPARRWKR